MRKILIVLFLGINSVLHAADYYVKNGGSDSNTGLDDNNAWAHHPWMSTWTGSIELVPGDRVFMKRGGVWTISNPTESYLIVSESGTEGSYITTSAYGTGSKPVISITTNTPVAVIYSESKSFIVFNNLEIRHYDKIQNLGYYHGIAVTSANSTYHDWIITNCDIHNCPNSGINIGGDSYNITIGDLNATLTATQNSYSNNIYDCGYTGIAMGGCNPQDLISNYKVYFNYIHDINVSGEYLSNAYGIVFSSAASEAGATNYCYTRYNYILNVPTWHGLNCHNGKNMFWQDNYVSNCLVGIVTAPNVRGGDWDPVLDNNYIERNIIENASSHPYGDYIGISVTGEEPALATNCFVRDNVIYYKSRPNDEASSCGIVLKSIDGCNISGNNILNGPTISSNGALMLSHNLRNISFYNNYIKDWSPGIFISPSGINGRLDVYNNIIQNFGNAISCEGSGILKGNIAIHNNSILCTITDNYYVPLRLYLNELPTGTSIKVKNNIIGFPVSSDCMYIKSPKILSGTFECDYNLYWNSRMINPFEVYDDDLSFNDWQIYGYDTHSVYNSDPKFVNSTGNYEKNIDFELQSNSPAINKALIISTVPYDFFNNPRGTAPDIGALEYISDLEIPVTDIMITGDGGVNTITSNKGTLQLYSSVLPSNATTKTVAWSLINGTGQGSINSVGLVTAISNGTVTAKATATDDSGVNGTYIINIINQGIPDSPIYVSSVVENAFPSVIEMNYSLSLANIIPATSAFSVQVNSETRSVSSVTISGNKVLLTLSSPIAFGNVVTIAYTKPSTNPLQTSAGGLAATISSQSVTNRIAAPPAPAIPAYVNSTIENAAPSVIEISYSLLLANVIPAASAFSVKVNSNTRIVSSVSVSGEKVLLTLAIPVIYGNTVTVSYTPPNANPIQTPEGGKAASLSLQNVTNRVNEVSPPVIVIPPPVIPNTPPVPLVNYPEVTYSGFIGEINASGSFDTDGGKITYTWKIPNDIPVSSTTGPVISFLAPVIQSDQTYNFELTVSDGKTSETAIVPVAVIPYHSAQEMAEISSIEATDFHLSDEPSKAVDGNTSTMWSSKGDEQSLILELKSPFDIRHIMVAFHPGQSKESYFDIYCSIDGTSWDMILAKAKSCSFSGNLQVFEFPVTKEGTKYKFMKLVGMGNSIDNWNYVAEIRIFGIRYHFIKEYEDLIVKIYPNPAREIVTIRIDDSEFNPDFIKIVSMTGKVFFDNRIDSGIRQFHIPLNFKPGIYIIQMGNAKITQFTQKLIILD